MPLLATGWHLHYGTVELWGYARSVRIHEALGLAAAALTLLHFPLLLATRRVRDYRPPVRGLGRALREDVARYTVGIWRGERSDARGSEGARLNATQRLLYGPLVLLFLPAIALTGLLLLAPAAGLEAVARPRPRAIVATLHAAFALPVSLFLLVHLYMASIVGRGRMRLRGGPRARWLALGLALLPSALAAAEPTVERRLPPLPCFGCHSGTPGSRRIVTDARTGARKDVTVELARMAEGVHGRLACPLCHSRGFERFPHRPAGERRFPACRDCHPRSEPPEAAAADAAHGFARIEAEHAATPHAASFRKVRGERDCEACHHPHYMRASASLLLPARLRVEHDGPCRACHAADASAPLSDPLRPDLVSGHASVPHAARHLDAVRCVDCHASRFRAGAHDLLTGEAAAGCVDCHRRESALLTGLWRFVPDAGAIGDGFANAGLLEAHYVIGATRPVGVDRAIAWSLGLSILAIAAHALFRVTARLRRSVRR